MKIGDFEIGLKTIILVIVALIVFFGLISFFTGGDSVNVTDVGMTVNYNYKTNVAFTIIPTDTITEVNNVQLKNIEVTYHNGKTQHLEDVTFNSKNTYVKDNEYGFKFDYTISDDCIDGLDEYDFGHATHHIKGDIVINTVGGNEKVVGHIDYDVPASATVYKYSSGSGSVI